MKNRDASAMAELLRDDEHSPNVTKRKLVIDITKELADEAAEIAARSAGIPGMPDPPRILSQLEVLSVIQKTLDHISKAVAEKKKVELRNFGVFEVKIRKARVGRNPNRPEIDVPIPERAVVKFKPGKEMREAVLLQTPAAVKSAAVTAPAPAPVPPPAPPAPVATVPPTAPATAVNKTAVRAAKPAANPVPAPVATKPVAVKPAPLPGVASKVKVPRKRA